MVTAQLSLALLIKSASSARNCCGTINCAEHILPSTLPSCPPAWPSCTTSSSSKASPEQVQASSTIPLDTPPRSCTRPLRTFENEIPDNAASASICCSQLC